MNFIASAVSHQSFSVTWYPLSIAIFFRMSPPFYAVNLNSLASSSALVVFLTVAVPDILIIIFSSY